MINTSYSKPLLRAIYDEMKSGSTFAAQKKELAKDISVWFSKYELQIQQYIGIKLYACHIPGRDWLVSWAKTEEYMDNPANWKRSYFQNTPERLNSLIQYWRGLPEGPEKEEVFKGIVEDNIIHVGSVGKYMFRLFGTGDSTVPEEIPDDIASEMKERGYT